MLKVILGKKIGQTQHFMAEGKRLPVTLIEAGPCPVVQIKTEEKDGYSSVQLGFGQRKPKHTTKPIAGHIAGAKLKAAPYFLREIRIESQPEESADFLKPGDLVKIEDIFQLGDRISVIGTTKGKGYAGVVKRFGFAGGPRTHGQSDRERAPGSIGSTTTPGRVYKGKRMAGRMGQNRVTIKGLKIVNIDPEKNLLMVKGLVPGSKNSFLMIRKD